MSKAWRRRRLRDKYYRMAKRAAYRSRASYKLLQLDERFHLFRSGDAVVDLGASPGGWSQVARERCGAASRIVAVDRAKMVPLEGVEVLRADVTAPDTAERIRALLKGPADVVISDMAPDISGKYPYDHARSIDLCEHALRLALALLRPGGKFVVKVFRGDLFPAYLRAVRAHFAQVKAHSPKASRPQSAEIYVVARGKLGGAPSSADVEPLGDPGQPTAPGSQRRAAGRL